MLQEINDTAGMVKNLVKKFATIRNSLISLSDDEDSNDVSVGQVETFSRVRMRDDSEAVTDIPNYKMSRKITTVNGLMAEWFGGIEGKPAIHDLEETFGARWRSRGSERTFFCRRKVIIDHIVKVATEENLTVEVSAERLETTRLSMRLTLNGLYEYLQTLP